MDPRDALPACHTRFVLYIAQLDADYNIIMQMA